MFVTNVTRQNRIDASGVDMPNAVIMPVRDTPTGGQSERARAKVLVVDDERDIVLSVGRRLAHAGYEVEFASDGMEATKMAFQSTPDVIVLDIGMPCGDGHLVAERLRTNIKTMFTPIIYLTARTSDEDRAKAMEAGAFAYVTKPFRSEELLSIIDQAVDREE